MKKRNRRVSKPLEPMKALAKLYRASMDFWMEHGRTCRGGKECDAICIAIMEAGRTIYAARRGAP